MRWELSAIVAIMINVIPPSPHPTVDEPIGGERGGTIASHPWCLGRTWSSILKKKCKWSFFLCFFGMKNVGWTKKNISRFCGGIRWRDLLKIDGKNIRMNKKIDPGRLLSDPPPLWKNTRETMYANFGRFSSPEVLCGETNSSKTNFGKKKKTKKIVFLRFDGVVTAT